MKFSKALFFELTVAILLVTLTGCSLMGAYNGYGVNALALGNDTEAVKLQDAITKSADGTRGFVAKGCFSIPVSGVPDATCQQQRNAAIAVLLNTSDDMCQTHLKSIFGNEAGVNITTGSLATFFAGAATVVNTASAKTTLAAFSGFFSAERSLINETVYKSAIVTAVTKKIREARAAKAVSIIPGNFAKPMGEYPMVLAVHDVMDYHYSCSFMYGLEKALEEGSQSGFEAKTARLEQEKNRLELYVDNRTRHLSLTSGVPPTSDPGIVGANIRISTIEAQLLNLVNAGALASASSVSVSVSSIPASSVSAASSMPAASSVRAH